MVAVHGANMNPNSLANLRPPVKGEVRNPSGLSGPIRRMGKKLAHELEKDFEQFGAEAICELRENDPKGYLQVIVSLLPKEANINVTRSPFDGLTSEQLALLADGLEQLASILDADQGGAAAQVIEGQVCEVH